MVAAAAAKPPWGGGGWVCGGSKAQVPFVPHCTCALQGRFASARARDGGGILGAEGGMGEGGDGTKSLNAGYNHTIVRIQAQFIYIYSLFILAMRGLGSFHIHMKETNWHHAPLHRFVPGAIHMVTGATRDKVHFYDDATRLDVFQEVLLEHLYAHGWIPHAWACLSNHYHFLAKAPEAGDLKGLIQRCHSQLGLRMNALDATPGRMVMYQFWDRAITHDNSYYARLKYVMTNPVKHGLVEDARTYRWCSAKWFHETHASPFRRRVMSYGIEHVQEPDDF